MTSFVSHARRRALSLWPWLVPIAVAGFIFLRRGSLLPSGVSALLALTVVLIASRRPDRCILFLIVGLPFQGLVLAQFYAWGVPGSIVRPLGGWKEVVALAVVVAGVRGFRASGRRLDNLDLLALGYIAILVVYAVLPHLFAPGAPAALNARSLAFRYSATFVVLLLAARHAQLPRDFATRAARVVLIVGGVVAAIAVYEYFFSDAWNSFIVDRVKYLKYQVEVLDARPFSMTDVRRYNTVGGRDVLRAGSVFLDSSPCGFFLLLPFAVAVERRLRSGRGGGALLFMISLALLFTQTRAALIGALVIVYLAVRPAAGRTSRRRVQFGFILAAGLILAVPVASATGLNDRITTATNGQDQSATDHENSFWDSVEVLHQSPFGKGLGTAAGIGQRFIPASATVSENNYLQVGVETGIISMIVFGALMIVLVRRLTQATRRVPDLGVAATRSAAIALAIGALFLHTWDEFAVSWTFWAMAGVAIGAAEGARRRASVPPATEIAAR